VRRAAVVSPLRTAVGSFGGTLKPLTADLLAVAVIQAVMQRSGLAGGEIDEVIVAQSYQSSEAPCVGTLCRLGRGPAAGGSGLHRGSAMWLRSAGPSSTRR